MIHLRLLLALISVVCISQLEAAAPQRVVRPYGRTARRAGVRQEPIRTAGQEVRLKEQRRMAAQTTQQHEITAQKTNGVATTSFETY